VTRGPCEAALLATLRQRGVKVTAPGDHAALIVLARTLAVELDSTDHPSASMAGVYLTALRQLLDATKPVEVEDDSTAVTLERLRSVCADLVDGAQRFADACFAAITDPAVAALAPGVGAVDQWIDNTNVLSAPPRARRASSGVHKVEQRP